MGKESKVNKVLKELRVLVNENNFNKQPETALEEIIRLGIKYGVNTEEILKGKYNKSIDEEDLQKWLKEYETYINFEGKDKNINQIR